MSLAPTGTLGPYRILAEVGRGGMAVVYKAYDPRSGRYVALKVLPAYFQHDRQFLERFHREAEAVSALQHPNIVRVYGTGEAGNYHYLAMEYAEGGSLASLLAQQPGGLAFDQILEIVRQVGAALDHAHSRGLVHRDLKPSNILIGGDGRVLLSDFGIAKVMGRSTLTGPGAIMGTPAYMAPEQARGQRDVDGRADVYALGIVLYEMLTGQVPFEGDTPLSVLRTVIDDPPRRPTALNAGIPPALEAVVLRALEKDPAHRYQGAGQVAAALQAALPSSPAGGGPKTVTPQPGPAASRPSISGQVPAWLFVTAGSLVAVALVLALVVAFLQPKPPATGTAIAAITGETLLPAPSATGNQPSQAGALPGDQGTEVTLQPPLPPPATETLAPTDAQQVPPPSPTASTTPKPAPSATPRPTFTAQPPYPAPVLEQPDDGARIADRDTVELRWAWNGTLQDDEHFDVRVWREGEEHLGIAWTGVPYLSLHIPSLDSRLDTPDRTGTYFWAVAVIRGTSGTVSKQLSPESRSRQFFWEGASQPEETPTEKPTKSPPTEPPPTNPPPTNPPPPPPPTE